MNRVLRSRIRSEAVVTLKSGEAFRGLLAEWDSKAVVLRNVELVSAANGKHLPVDGEVIVMTQDVAFVQVPS